MSYQKSNKDRRMKERIITQKSLIDMISADTGFKKIEIQKVIDSLENAMQVSLAQVNEKENIKIKLMPGIIVEANYQPDKVATDPRTGKNVVAKERVMLKVNVLKSFKQKVNERFNYRRNLLLKR